jgi:hypothetical protein
MERILGLMNTQGKGGTNETTTAFARAVETLDVSAGDYVGTDVYWR